MMSAVRRHCEKTVRFQTSLIDHFLWHARTKTVAISQRPVKSDLMSTILGGFDGEFPPVARRIGYRLGLILVTMAMVVLPLLYLGLVAGVIYLLYWHATANLGPLKSTHSFRAIVFLYAGP